jgi:hypothetical protein
VTDWKRTTREVPFEGLMPDVASAINAHIELYNLGSILSDSFMCIQTDAEKAKKGLFGKTEYTLQVAVVTSYLLIWAVLNANTPAVLSAQLSNVTVQDYAQTPFAKMVPDSGIQVNGLFTDASESASAFIGLDNSATARKFKEILIKAVQDAKR